jgi:prepilin-type N-terminal cleavage/methylation domain-containing protein
MLEKQMLKSINRMQRGYSLIEIILTIGIGAIIATTITFGLFNFRDNVQYDIVINEMVESVDYAKVRAMKSQLDAAGQKSNYGVIFFEDSFVEFEGNGYVEGLDSNVLHNIPFGFSLDVTCDDLGNSIVFARVTGINSNPCEIDIYKWEDNEPTGSVVIGPYGVEEAY